MSSRGDATLPATRRSRKSVGNQSPNRKAREKENATVDVGSTMAAASRKKSRSKSMGPGGLDVLKSGNGNRRVSLAAPSRPPPRSILKPTIPLLPEIPPHNPKGSGGGKNANQSNGDDNTGGSSSKVALRTEEEQQAAAREREERERAQLEKEINDRREARRKSLANRRVSFAAEATLHTFHEIEYMQDSTTSTDSTRRASSLAAQSPAPSEHPNSDPPSTPPEQVEEDVVAESPANQRDLHQRKRRRSSGIPPLNFNNPDDDTMTTMYSSDSEHGDGVTEIEAEEASNSSSDSDDDGTMMTVEAEEMTSASVASTRHGAYDEDDEEEEEEVIPSFGWIKKNNSAASASHAAPQAQVPADANDQDTAMSMDIDMEMTSAVGGIMRPGNHSPQQEEPEDMDMSMDVTKAVGGILRPANSGAQDEEDEQTVMSMDVTKALGGILAKPNNRKQLPTSRPSPSKSSADDSALDDATMDLTMAVGGIQGRTSNGSQISADENEDMSMEFTTAVGGLLTANKPKAATRGGRRRSVAPPKETEDDDATMDMTVAVGRVLPAADENDEDADATMGMDMTMAVGGIIKPASPAKSRAAAKKVMEQEVDIPDPTPSTTLEVKSPPKKRPSTVMADTKSPGLTAFRGNGLRRSPTRAVSPPKTATPSKPSPAEISQKTPSRTPSPPKMIGSRSSSPMRPASPVARTTPRSPSPSKGRGNKVFNHDPQTGASTPKIVLTPQRPRRLSGLGVDRSGLGSPRIAEIIDRRESLGDAANGFMPGNPSNMRRGVTFEDPRAMAEEVDKQRQDDEDKENARRILEREADDTTLNLREMIESMTPKKNPLKGRKSLAVGTGKALLGKRPIELDDDDDDGEENDGVKRLKGHQGSPVKNVHLRSPPSKAETTGRATRGLANRKSLALVENLTPRLGSSPLKGAPSPKGQGRFREVEDDQPTATVNFDEHPVVDEDQIQEDENEGDEPIHLQDFLNMTSIRFMELTTTKRRHTVAPSAPRNSSAAESKDDLSLERCVVASACTVPMLELYQHSCRELKKYISEGRQIMREIETETLEDNPPLFREYMAASPKFRQLMDNQFKNVKTHARLLSKAMWYEWRMKLQDGLKEGLVRIGDGLAADDKILKKQQDLLDSVLPALVEKFEAIEKEVETLDAMARELADCDPEDLESARADLMATDEEIEEKTRMIAELRQQLQEAESGVSSLSEQKQRYLGEIKDAEKIREECRGWSSTEISALKARVDAIEKQHGWAVTGVAGAQISMTYRREIELVFDIASLASDASTIDLWYIGASRERNPIPATPEKDFFLQCIRDLLRSRSWLAQDEPEDSPETADSTKTNVSRMLGLVSAAWDRANQLANQVRLLNVSFPTTVARTSDDSIAVASSILLAPLETKVEVVLNLHHRRGSKGEKVGLDIAVVPQVKVVYGEQFNVPKMTEYLAARLGDGKETGSWSDALVELYGRLLARGRK